MAAFLARLDDVAARDAAAADPRGRRGRGRGRGPGRASGSRTRSSPASTCPTRRWPSTGAPSGSPRASPTSCRCRSPTTRFDLVLAIEVLEHVPDPAAALRELARVARRDVVLSVPREPIWRAANMARGKYWGDLGNTPGHIQHWSRAGFVRLVGAHLEVVDGAQPDAVDDGRRARARLTRPGRATARSAASGRLRARLVDHRRRAAPASQRRTDGAADQRAERVDEHEDEPGDDRDRGAHARPAPRRRRARRTRPPGRRPRRAPARARSRRPTRASPRARSSASRRPGRTRAPTHQVAVPISSQAGR